MSTPSAKTTEHQRKLSEQNQNRLARAVKLLSNCCSVLVRAEKEQELLVKICQLVVETGGYLMAWVGYAENDAGKSVRPVAQFGYAEGYLDNINITWTDTESGHGPTGTAIRKGAAVTVQDIQTDPEMALWRDSATKRGYHSIVALPLVVNRQVLGALTIYSSEASAFGKEEVGLLEDLANDLAFGIQTLRTRVEYESTLLALKRERDRNLALLRNASDGIHILDADGNIIDASDSFCSMLGYRRDEIFAINVSQLDVALVDTKLQNIIKNQYEQQARCQFETSHRRKDGSIFDVEVSCFPLELDGKPVLFCSSRDITERKRIENHIHENEQRLLDILNVSPIAVRIATKQGREVVFYNPRYADLIKNFHAIGDDPTKYYVRIEEYEEVLAELARGNKVINRQIELYIPDGSTVWALASYMPIRYQGEDAALGWFYDITERKLAEELLLRQKQFSEDVINSLPGIFYMLNKQGSFIRVNAQFQEVSGYSMDELDTMSALSFFDGKEKDLIAQRIQQAFETGDTSVEADFIIKSGQKIPYYFSGHRTIINGETYIIGLGTDISERKRLSRELNEREELFSAIFNQAPFGIELIDPDTLQFVEANPAACQMLGYTHEEFLRLRLIDTQSNMDEERLIEAVRQVEASAGVTFKSRHRTRSGDILDVEVNSRFLSLPGKRLLVGVWRDITESKRAEETLRITASVFDNTQEAIMITDVNNAIVNVNSAFTQITGYGREEVIGKNPKLLGSSQHGQDYFARMWACLNKSKAWRGEVWNQRKSGEIYAGMLSVSAICGEDGEVQRYVAVFSDISYLKKHEAELKRIAHYDALTNIPNRSLLADRMKHSIAQTAREQSMMAVCYLDLDGFKPINDTMGHDAGDQVLIEVAKRIGSTIRGGDTVARLGGDEFVILLLGLENGGECMTTLDRLLNAIAQPIIVKNKSHTISASIGVSIYPLDNEDPDTLLRHADQAMYVAKQSGKNCFYIYDPELDMRARDHDDFIKTIRHGLELDQFELFYQPKVNLRTKKLVGAEALIRWRHPERGLLSPAEFLRHIENTDLDIKIGEWVTATAIAQINRWRHAGLDIEVSINISAYHLESQDFLEKLLQQLALYPDMPHGKLQIEMLETAALSNVAVVGEIIEACQKIGVLFALDDFGTGYSSLTYLSNLPVNVLKIDQSFVRDMLEDKGDMAIVQGIIALARAFDRETVAEGIETGHQYQVLLDMGCEIGQGYYIAKPMQADELTRWRATFRF